MKAKSHDVVKNKLREQIMEVLYGKPLNKIQTNFEKDLASTGMASGRKPSQNNNISAKPMSLKSDNFADTFEHFSDEVKSNSNEIGTYENNSYSYL
jgi:hypothetical protein